MYTEKDINDVLKARLSDRAIKVWWNVRMAKLDYRTPREVFNAGDTERVNKVVEHYLGISS